MTPEALAALRGSIAKWESISNGSGVDYGTKNCPLCQIFNADGGRSNEEGDLVFCFGCPVSARTGQDSCEGTPYESWWLATRGQGLVEGRRPTNDAAKSFARAELAFLISLLPGD